MAQYGQQIAELVQSVVASDEYLNDPNRALTVRRTRIREKLHKTIEY